MGKFKDLVGNRFGELIVLERAEDYISPSGVRGVRWKCQCQCENKTIAYVRSCDLTSGKTKSCGCVHSKSARERFKKYNRYELHDDYVIMYTQKNEVFLIDTSDFERVREHCWHQTPNGYFITQIKGKNILLHRFIMNCYSREKIDHIGGSKTKYDNRKQNLRIATQSQNEMNKVIQKNNTSGITGVCWDKNRSTWFTYIKINKKSITLGYFKDFDEAVKVRKKAEEKYFGEYSYDNSQKLYEQANA